MNNEYIEGASCISREFNFRLGSLSLLIGQREMLANEILRRNWENFKDPWEYKDLLFANYKGLNDRIKTLLYIE